MMEQPSPKHNHEKDGDAGKSWYFRFDGDNRMSEKCIFSTTKI